MVFKEIKNYSYDIITRDDHPARLNLFDNDNKIIARVVFVKDSLPLPENRDYEDHSFIHFKFSALAPIIDMLRNEKPVFYHWIKKAKIGHITTSKEPVGEKEHSSE